jgi:hypothetical protein
MAFFFIMRIGLTRKIYVDIIFDIVNTSIIFGKPFFYSQYLLSYSRSIYTGITVIKSRINSRYLLLSCILNGIYKALRSNIRINLIVRISTVLSLPLLDLPF